MGRNMEPLVVAASVSRNSSLHGPYAQSQSVAGFGAAELQQLQRLLAAPTPTLTLAASDWMVCLGLLACANNLNERKSTGGGSVGHRALGSPSWR